MQSNYSCDKCAHRGCERKCRRCFHEADKKPTKFKLDKSARVCPALSGGGQDCEAVLAIRDWQRKIREINEEIQRRDQDSVIDAKPIMDFIKAVSELQFHQLHCYEDYFLVEGVLSTVFTYVSCDKLIVALDNIRNRENTRITLRRERDDLQKKVDDAMRGLGIQSSGV